MRKIDKVAFVERCVGVLSGNDSLIFLHCGSSDVGVVTKLRFELRNGAGAKLMYGKNSLWRVALRRARPDLLDDLDGYLSHSISVAFSNDMVSLSKVVSSFVKGKEGGGIKVVCGLLDGGVVERDGIERVAMLPTVDEMRASMVHMLISGPQRIVSCIEHAPISLVRALGTYLEQLKS